MSHITLHGKQKIELHERY